VTGTLYLLPVSLGAGAWQAVLPALTRDTACQLTDFIVENAKSARAALKWMEHPAPLRAVAMAEIPEAPDAQNIENLIAPLLAGRNVGLMSEAGCPAVADPGALIVRRTHELGIPVKPMVGPSALLLALMASGLDGQRFAFHGYLPARAPERSLQITQLEKESRLKRQTQLFIETPYRNQQLFSALCTACQPGTRLCIASDISTSSESVVTLRIDEWRKRPAPNLDRRPTVFLLLA